MSLLASFKYFVLINVEHFVSIKHRYLVSHQSFTHRFLRCSMYFCFFRVPFVFKYKLLPLCTAFNAKLDSFCSSQVDFSGFTLTSSLINGVLSGQKFQTRHRETNESTMRRAFIVSRCLEPLMKHEARVFELASQTSVKI